jgi:PPOX class probable F420-dependent enzyme
MADTPIQLDELTRRAVSSGRLVHLATINPDGSPQVTCIYVGWDGDEIVAGHLADHVKLRNIRRDPRVTLSIESDEEFEGFSPYLVIRGVARVEEGGAVPLLRRITHDAFPPPGDWPDGFVMRISPRHLSGIGPWGLAE